MRHCRGGYWASQTRNPKPETRNPNFGARPTRRGTVLIVTMWVVFALAGVALVFSANMRTEIVASGNAEADAQAAAIERGAEHHILAKVDQEKQDVLSLPDSENIAHPVGEGYFWIIRPNFGDDTLPSYGLIDEASKVNLNTAPLQMLLNLPGMTDELAACIIDWRDADSDPTQNGAESDYYLNLASPYNCKNADFDTVEELALVKGATRELIYGAGPSTRPTFSSDASQQHGLFPYLTVYSAEPAASASSSSPPIDINNQQQRTALSQYLTEQLGASRAAEIQQRATRRPFVDAFDFFLQGQFKADEMDKVFTRLTAGAATPAQRRGRVNVYTAPRDVLRCIPGLGDTEADSLISARTGQSNDPSKIGWIVTALKERAAGVSRYITTASYQYAAEVVAVSGNGRAYRRCRIVVDARTTPARIVYRRDITDLGWPLAPEILQSLRNGQAPPDLPIPAGKGAL